jgi:hypothetical protein
MGADESVPGALDISDNSGSYEEENTFDPEGLKCQESVVQLSHLSWNLHQGMEDLM